MTRTLTCLCLASFMLVLGACAPVTEETAVPAVPGDPNRSIVNVTGDLYRARSNQHFTVFLVTDEGIILSDPINREFATWLRSELETRFAVPVRYVLYSHSHYDHASGGGVFADTAEFVGHENMRQALADPNPDTPLPANAQELDTDGNGTLEAAEAAGNFQSNFALFDADGDGSLSGGEIARGPVGDVHPPTTVYTDRHTVTLGGRTVEMIHPGPAHSADMSVISFPEESALFVVDFISLKRLPFQTFAGSGPLDAWLDEMRAIEAMGAEIVIPGHGAVGTTEDVAEHRRYLEELRDAVAEGIAAGRSLEEMQETILMESYSGWGNYEEWRTLNIEGMYGLLSEE